MIKFNQPEFTETSDFQKDFKKLKRRHFSSIQEHFQILKKVLSINPLGNSNKKFHLIKETSRFKFLKFRLFRKNMHLRFIYAYCKEENKLDFIELYSKSDKENHNDQRIKQHIKSHAHSDNQ